MALGPTSPRGGPCPGPGPRLPACAWWNLRYLCLGPSPESRTKRLQKIENVRFLSSQHPIVGLSELHDVDSAQAQRFFFDQVPGVTVFHDGDLATVVDAVWAKTHGITPSQGDNRPGPSFHGIIPGVMHAIHWPLPGGARGWFINYHLDATSDPSVRISQLRHAAQWAKSQVGPGPRDVVLAGGDRNFTCSDAERCSSR